jgi:NAD-dependent deacetylase
MTENTLYITGAGVSAESGIPTFRGNDGFWTIGSVNYTPQEMATRHMYQNNPEEFLLWYFKRFASYRNVMPNKVHHFLSNKRLITQNVDGLDGKAGNKDYIPIHGRLDKALIYDEMDNLLELTDAPWDEIDELTDGENHDIKIRLLDAFRISKETKKPELGKSLRPFILLFDEYYTDQYRMSEAESWMRNADHYIFMGTSFSVNITNIALRYAIQNNALIEIVDPEPVDLRIPNIKYHKSKAQDYILDKFS